jgi:hypothetical protein
MNRAVTSRAQGNTEGTPASARASTNGHSFSADRFGLRDFRARGFPSLPSRPASELNGKEGVDGSSPEALQKSCTAGLFLFRLYLHGSQRAVGMEPFMEPSGR